VTVIVVVVKVVVVIVPPTTNKGELAAGTKKHPEDPKANLHVEIYIVHGYDR
jgi:hypothetical protein